MRPTNFATVGLIGLIGCVEPASDSTPATLLLEPANVTVTVIDGQPVAQQFRATRLEDGIATDVTAETTFVLADSAFGDWSASQLEIDGDAVGPTRVMAANGALQAEASLTVYARTNRFFDAPANAPALFESAVAYTACAPAISYPADDVLVPANLGELDVQWADARNDLFEVSVATTYLETRIYTRRADEASHRNNAAWTKLAAADWNRVAAERESIALRVSGLVETAPDLRCTTAAQRIHVTDQPVTGAFFVAHAEGWQRVAADPAVAPETLFNSNLWDAMIAPLSGGPVSDCIGCAISRDGSRLAIGSPTTAAIYDFQTGALTASGSQGWTHAAFTPNGDKLITADAGDLRIITRNGSLLSTIAHRNGYQSFDPQMSPDGRTLVNVEAIGDDAPTTPIVSDVPAVVMGDQTVTLPSFGSTIVIRQFSDGANEMSSSTELMPLELGVASYFPAWSPDGRYVAFTRTAFDNLTPTTSLWIVKADGTQAPIQLTAGSSYLGMRARFVPTALTTGGERVYMIAFDSREAFGEQLAAGRLQMWTMPFYPDRAVESANPCLGTPHTECTSSLRAVSPAMRLPAQSLWLDNRMMQWID